MKTNLSRKSQISYYAIPYAFEVGLSAQGIQEEATFLGSLHRSGGSCLLSPYI